MAKNLDDDFESSTERHYAAIGKAAAVWAEFEYILQSVIWRLAGVDPDKRGRA
jgi:hypothetical protein